MNPIAQTRTTPVTPDGWPVPAAHSHGVMVAAGSGLLSITGQVGVDASGQVGATFEAQAEIACLNLRAVLHAAGMEFQHLVKTTVYLTDAADIPAWRDVRARVMGDCRPSSTLVVVAGLAQAAWRFEIDGLAAR